MLPGKHLAGALQSGYNANLFGAQYVLQTAGIYCRKMGIGTLPMVCSRESWQVLSVGRNGC